MLCPEAGLGLKHKRKTELLAKKKNSSPTLTNHDGAIDVIPTANLRQHLLSLYSGPKTGL